MLSADEEAVVALVRGVPWTARYVRWSGSWSTPNE